MSPRELSRREAMGVIGAAAAIMPRTFCGAGEPNPTARARQRMARLVVAECSDKPLKRCVKNMRDVTGATIEVDWPGLEKEELTPDTVVHRFDMTRTPAHAVVRLLFEALTGEQNRIGYLIDNGVVRIVRVADHPAAVIPRDVDPTSDLNREVRRKLASPAHVRGDTNWVQLAATVCEFYEIQCFLSWVALKEAGADLRAEVKIEDDNLSLGDVLSRAIRAGGDRVVRVVEDGLIAIRPGARLA